MGKEGFPQEGQCVCGDWNRRSIMGVLSNLEPQNVFHFFEEITKIPHGSGNVGQISDYLVKFARDKI